MADIVKVKQIQDSSGTSHDIAARSLLDSSGNEYTSDSFLKLTGGNMTGPLGFVKSSQNQARFEFVDNGFFSSNTGSVSGMLLIALPANLNSRMIKFKVSIYDYAANASVEYAIGGYPYSDGVWYNTFAYCLGNEYLSRLTVRFYYRDSTGRFNIGIGDTNTSWTYPKVYIKDVEIGYNTTTGWNTDWLVTITSTAPTQEHADYTNTGFLSNNGGTLSGQLYVNLSTVNKPSYRFNKSGSYYTGIGYHGTDNETYFGATDYSGNWTNSNVEVFNFGGSIKENGTLLESKYLQLSNVSSAGNAAANTVVARNAAGSIQTEKLAVSSGTTTKATIQYNTTEDCIDFIFN